ncbi:MAG: ABC transporter permease [Phycisphaerae bacterium]|jgi:predicted permease
MSGLVQDLKFALRKLWREPGFSVVVVVTLAVAVAACAVVFDAGYHALIRPLPYRDQDRLVVIHAAYPPLDNWFDAHSSFPNYCDFREQCAGLEDLAAYRITHVNYTVTQPPERLAAVQITANAFGMLGIPALVGNTFGPSQDEPGAEPVVLLGEQFWRRRLNASPVVVGQQVTLGNQEYTVLGVIPESFDDGTFEADVWMPLAPAVDVNERYANTIRLLGVRKPDTSLAQLDQELNAIEQRLEEAYPTEVPHARLRALSLRDARLGPERPLALKVLALGVTFVLLIACCNVASLLLARALGRSGEIALRAALGAGPGRLLRQFVAESAVLAGAAAVLGGLLTLWGSQAVHRLLSSPSIEGGTDVASGSVLLIVVLVAAVAVLPIGVAPALTAARAQLRLAQLAGGHTVGSSGRRGRLRETFVVSQIALATVLLVGAGLMLNSLYHLEHVAVGYDSDDVLTARVSLPDYRYPEPRDRSAFFAGVLERLQQEPGCAAAAIADSPPGVSSSWTFCQPEGYTVEEAEQRGYPGRMIVTPGYWATMGVPLLRGRALADTDDADASPVAVVNQAFADAYWPGQDPLGKRLRFTLGHPWCTVVGVAANTRQGPRDEVRPEVYVPNACWPQSSAVLLVRAAQGNPQALAGAVRRAVWAVDASQPIHNMRTLRECLGRVLFRWRAYAGLLAGFAGVALILAAVGVYAVMSHAVGQRQREIGVRIAVGASGGAILGMVMRRSALLTGLGLAIGLVGALIAGRFLRSLLFEVTPLDPATLVAAAVVLGGAALGAGYLPARRATKIDPLVALRCE